MKIKIDVEIDDNLLALIEKFGYAEVNWVHNYMRYFDINDIMQLHQLFGRCKEIPKLFNMDKELLESRLEIINEILAIGWRVADTNLAQINTIDWHELKSHVMRIILNKEIQLG